MRRESPIVDVEWLVAATWGGHRRPDRTVGDGARRGEVILADVRWSLSGGGRDAYLGGHLPGAHFVDLDRELSSPPGSGRPGRHPLPDPARFAALASRLGVSQDSVVVAYDDAGGAIAARLWWLFRYFGLPHVGRVLSGGIGAWIAAGHPLETAEPAPATAPPLETAEPAHTNAPPLELAPRPEMVVDAGAVATLLAAGAAVLDARAPERYRGDHEPVDPRAGHIPGAHSAPLAGNLSPAGGFLDAAELEARFRALGVRDGAPIVCYCGSGVTACHDLLALALVGRGDALLYEGSWSDWSSDPSRPVATGDD